MFPEKHRLKQMFKYVAESQLSTQRERQGTWKQKFKTFLKARYRTLNLNWRFEEEIPLRTSHTFICTMGSSGAKGVQAFVWLGTISECVLKHLKKWNMMHPKTPSWGKEECQHQDKYYVLTYCTPTTPEASLSRELYLRTHLVSLGGTKAGSLKEWIFK